jgi:hypothetical protein
MKVVISNPSKRLFSFQFSEKERDKILKIFSVYFVPLLKAGCQNSKYRHVTVSEIRGISYSTRKLLLLLNYFEVVRNRRIICFVL